MALIHFGKTCSVFEHISAASFKYAASWDGWHGDVSEKRDREQVDCIRPKIID